MANIISFNKIVSRTLTPRHIHEANVFGAYWKIGAIILSHPEVRKVADVGCGKKWHFPPHYKDWYNLTLIGLDIDQSEMNDNSIMDEKIKCDAVIDIPLKSGSIDLVMVNSGVEHFSSNEMFLNNAFRILRPGGFLLAQFPGRYAPFAIANRIFPKRITKMLLAKFMDDPDALGFRAYYDKTHYTGFKRTFKKVGFEELYYLPGFYSSSYFEFFFPVFLISYTYDAIRFTLGVKNLSSYNLWLLRKPGSGNDVAPFRLYAWE